jgi:hypothetical protein
MRHFKALQMTPNHHLHLTSELTSLQLTLLAHLQPYHLALLVPIPCRRPAHRLLYRDTPEIRQRVPKGCLLDHQPLIANFTSGIHLNRAKKSNQTFTMKPGVIPGKRCEPACKPSDQVACAGLLRAIQACGNEVELRRVEVNLLWGVRLALIIWV